MLDLQPARGKPPQSNGKFGLALAGGGPLGAFYEIGALQAVGEAFEGMELTDLDMYCGVSSGAMVAAGLANGFDTADMGVVFIYDCSPQHSFKPGQFLRPALREFGRRLSQVPGLLRHIAGLYLQDPARPWTEALEPLGHLVPNGIFDNGAMERVLADLFTSDGRTNDFRKLQRRLYVIATEVSTGHSVRFGEPGNDHVPISRAIQASTALPGLYPPVAIDGRAYADGALLKTMNASLLLDDGAQFVICVNPLVAFDASRAPRHRNDGYSRRHDLSQSGLPTVLSQTFRAMIQSRMQVGMRTYKLDYPHADVLLFEPDCGDEEMFFQNVFSYADRKRLAERAYQRTRRDMLAQADGLEKMLGRHGLGLRRDVLRDRSRTFAEAVQERRRRLEPVTGPLHRTLDRLEHLLAAHH